MSVLYFLLWVIYNGKITLEICLFGILISTAIFAFSCKFMDYSIEKEKQLFHIAGKFSQYVCVLVYEIVKANLAVVHMILSEREEIQPAVFDFHTDVKTITGRSLLANSITLTPGTITVSLEGSRYTVHCLDESLAPGSDDSVFVQRIKEMENI